MVSTIKSAFITGLKHWKIVLLVYFLQLLMAVPLAMQVWHVVEASIGNSLEINKLLPGYDHTVISDFLKVHGGSITPLIGQLRWALVVWALASVFINAGILFTLVKKSPNWLAFWTGGASYFYRFTKIATIFLFILLVWTGITILPYLANLQVNLETMASEKTVLGYLLVLVLLWLAGVVYLYCASIVAKTAIIKQDLTTWKALKKGLGHTFRNYFSLAGIFLVFSALQLLALGVYWWLESRSGMVSVGLVLVFFLLQQGLVFWRLMGRVMMVGGISSYYNEN